ncbi:3-hydroxy-3-methylglutaryl-coenzyme A reductase [Scardovia inopinata]|uniref:Hydroxymethylglutaryl-CoA reductase, degradative n=1 Tax=Scardovia inopinata F0304 TaxID=641146 RepID=W1MXB3_SCAIO|nr:hydroxymethylglutaryl-CoA reductase [Scardovia inopinata]EQW17314.1 hydroxymethylglutaryl-CoA reductase, degradative [Scardovia inopinata F0304]BAR06452.1 hydroxymethylglutaryl-CoA reductase [Scardovia inopinata JCM 12537]SUV51970.1 3-hydroxy-3-methylglutaryl-coenzyme A reductase [Scardovia inopinata]
MKFYQLSPEDRIKTLVGDDLLSPEDASALLTFRGLDDDIANNLIENQIGQFALPMGIVRNLAVNGRNYQVLMATEEPSVIAAANNGARIARLNGFVVASAPKRRLVTGEIVFGADSDQDADRIAQILRLNQDKIKAIADQAHPSILSYGGGLVEWQIECLRQAQPRGQVQVRERVQTWPREQAQPYEQIQGKSQLGGKYFVKLALHINTGDAMGANIVNTICEAVASASGSWVGRKALVAILTNRVDESQTVKASLEINPKTLKTKDLDGPSLARRIEKLSNLAFCDYDRAVTHNKGIMNGITASALATGNDTRALESAAHSYAAREGVYRPLSEWTVNEKGNLEGRLHMPLSLGTVGGATDSLPMAALAKRVSGAKSVGQFQCLLAALGLVQNLAALRALAGPGIQQGHMALHARSLAMAAGAQGAEISLVSNRLQDGDKSLERAKQILESVRARKNTETGETGKTGKKSEKGENNRNSEKGRKGE